MSLMVCEGRNRTDVTEGVGAVFTSRHFPSWRNYIA
jgi:hypothetical protein